MDVSRDVGPPAHTPAMQELGIAVAGVLRVIYDLAGRPPWWQMALDEALLESVASSKSPPTLRLYVFSPSSVTIGYFQSVHEAVRLDEAQKLGIPVVRRFTGGGAVYHDEEGEITYSIAVQASGMLRDVASSYRVLCSAIANALRRLGVDAAPSGFNDVTVAGRKISGNAQARRRGALLQHGTILYNANKEVMRRLLKVHKEKLNAHGAGRIDERIVNLVEVAKKPISLGELAESITAAFSETLGLKPVEGWYSRGELELARKYVGRYRSSEWNLKR